MKPLSVLGVLSVIAGVTIILGLFTPFAPVATSSCSLSFFGLFCISGGTSYSYNPYNTYLAVGLVAMGAILLLLGGRRR